MGQMDNVTKFVESSLMTVKSMFHNVSQNPDIKEFVDRAEML